MASGLESGAPFVHDGSDSDGCAEQQQTVAAASSPAAVISPLVDGLASAFQPANCLDFAALVVITPNHLLSAPVEGAPEATLLFTVPPHQPSAVAASAKTPKERQAAGRGRGRGRGRGAGRGRTARPGSPHASEGAAAGGSEPDVLVAPNLMRDLEVFEAPAATQSQMGSFGSYAVWYAHEHSLGVPEEESARKVELQDSQAAQHDARMKADQEDMQQRKLTLGVMPPLNQPVNSLFQVRDGNSAGLSPIATVTNNYLFATQVAVYEAIDPQGRVSRLITCSDEVKARADADGLQRVSLEEVKSETEYLAWLTRIQQGSLQAGDLPDGVAEGDGRAEGEGSSPGIPGELTKSFRNEVIGDGSALAVQQVLFDVMEREFSWQGKPCAAIGLWERTACKKLWEGKTGIGGWEQAVLELKQVYAVLKAKSLGSVLELFDSTLDKTDLVGLSFSSVKKLAGGWVSRRPGKSARVDWHAIVLGLITGSGVGAE